MSRDDRPLLSEELGIPYDEFQLACYIASEGLVMQLCVNGRSCEDPATRFHVGLFEDRVDAEVERFPMRRASERLREAMRRRHR